jgi:hypothetical protein
MIADDTAPTTTIAVQPFQPAPHVDRFGNVIVGELGRFGQYRVVSAWDGRTVRVCGEAATAKHLPLWSYDADERRMVCRWCWPGMAGGGQAG